MEDLIIERSQSLVTRLYDAAFEGDVRSLLDLLEEDPLILNRYIIGRFVQSPLHIAANLGHSEFTKEILSRKPELAEELDQLKRWSPLHMASAKGYLEIVKALLTVKPNMCFTRDQDGRNPVHIAAINGQIHVLDELLKAKPRAAVERTNDGDSVLHLCVKQSQPEALMFLADIIDDGDELLNSKDADGNKVLHLAVAAKQPQLVKYLLKKERRMERNAINKNGSTAMDVCIKSRNDVNKREIWQSLKRANELPAKDALKLKREHKASRIEDHRSSLMVVASLIATMAFQVGVNPPGGAWQEDTTTAGHGANPPVGAGQLNNNFHVAGSSIMADKKEIQYTILMVMSSVALVSSLSVILILISGLPCNRLFVGILMRTMWIAITAITLTYAQSIIYLSAFEPKDIHMAFLQQGIVFFWLILMIMLLLIHAGRFIVKLIKKLYHKCFSRPATANHPTV